MIVEEQGIDFWTRVQIPSGPLFAIRRARETGRRLTAKGRPAGGVHRVMGLFRSIALRSREPSDFLSEGFGYFMFCFDKTPSAGFFNFIGTILGMHLQKREKSV